MTTTSSQDDTAAGEFEASSESRFVEYHCATCRATTKHLRDPRGVLHCRRCVLEVSARSSYDESASDESTPLPVHEPAAAPPRSRWIWGVIAGAVLVIVALIAYLVRVIGER